ncbi:MAG: hypothetical protein LBK59_04000 [Bifidobacteriaceae bacterium]|jgi:hypothetical protein|nr:hypothetical protein [Bifidobacteriaceae bacterium]
MTIMEKPASGSGSNAIAVTGVVRRPSTRAGVAITIACALAVAGLGSGCAGTAGGAGGTASKTTEGASPSTNAEPGGMTAEAGGLWIELPAYAEVTEIGGGIDANGNRWAEYADDAGAVAVSIRRASAVAATDPSEIESQVTVATEAFDAATWRLEASPEVSEAYTYPASVFEFDSGANEDRRSHLGLYFQTDAGGFVVDFSIPVDLWEEGHPLAEDWMKYLNFIDAQP